MTSFSAGCYFCFVLLLLCFVFRLYAFVEVAALSSIVLRYAGAQIATLFFFFEMSLFPSIFFCSISTFSFMESTSCVLSFLPCDHGLDF